MAVEITDSILKTVRKLIGGEENGEEFDLDLVIGINTFLQTLHQLGVGPTDKPFSISGDSETWADFFKDDDVFEMAKQYIVLRTRLVFDPPTNSFMQNALKEEVREMEWRLREAKELDW